MDYQFETIADGLATQSYAVIDQFLSQDEVNDFLKMEEFDIHSDAFRQAGIGHSDTYRIREGVRGDYIQWLDRKSASIPVKSYFQRVDELIQYLNRALFLSLKDFEAHFAIYPVGSFYKKHYDQFKDDDHRKLSVICYLNNNWQTDHGGQLRMYLRSGAIDVLPVAGRLVCFRSDTIEHEVLPATRERISITGWMLDQLAELRYLN